MVDLLGYGSQARLPNMELVQITGQANGAQPCPRPQDTARYNQSNSYHGA